MSEYLPTPAPPAPEPDEPAVYYGSRLVCYIISSSSAYRLTLEQLEAADHAITWLYGRRARPDEDLTCYLSGLKDARNWITRAQQARAQAAQAQAQTPAPCTSSAPPDQRDGGSREPRRPFPGSPGSPDAITPAGPVEYKTDPRRTTRNPQPSIDF